MVEFDIENKKKIKFHNNFPFNNNNNYVCLQMWINQQDKIIRLNRIVFIILSLILLFLFYCFLFFCQYQFNFFEEKINRTMIKTCISSPLTHDVDDDCDHHHNNFDDKFHYRKWKKITYKYYFFWMNQLIIDLIDWLIHSFFVDIFILITLKLR